MYLALLPSKESEAAIRAALPQCGELHLTIIHVPNADKPFDIRTTIEYWHDIIGGRLVAAVERLAVFGPPASRVLALKLKDRHSQGSDLFSLRHVAEECLQRAKIAWSKQWEFSPHITLGKAVLFGSVARGTASLPNKITFDRLEWRS